MTVERRRSPTPTRADLESHLVIDEDNIDESLVDQPGYFDQVAKAHAASNANYEERKLELKELLAELDGDIRRRAIEAEEKLTEKQLENRITGLPRVKDKSREVLAAKRVADDWATLKESFQQRSYMLRELNTSQIARLHNLGVERGATDARTRIGDRNRVAAERLRSERGRGD